MMEETKKQRGGKREGSGRPKGLSTTAMSLKLDNDLFDSINKKGINKNRLINDAVRLFLDREEGKKYMESLIKEQE